PRQTDQPCARADIANGNGHAARGSLQQLAQPRLCPLDEGTGRVPGYRELAATSRHGRTPVSRRVTDHIDPGGFQMSDTTTAWQAIPLVPYGAVLHVPVGWETLPPRPDNGPEIVRATGGQGRTLIIFKLPVAVGFVNPWRSGATP